MALVLVTLALIEQHLYHLIFILLSPRCTIRIGTEHEWRHPLLDLPTTLVRDAAGISNPGGLAVMWWA